MTSSPAGLRAAGHRRPAITAAGPEQHELQNRCMAASAWAGGMHPHRPQNRPWIQVAGDGGQGFSAPPPAATHPPTHPKLLVIAAPG